MSMYAAPQRSPRNRSLPRRAKILLVASLLVSISLLALAKVPVSAAPTNNPIFATFDYVQNAIDTALAPIHSAIASLQSQQANQASQISSLSNSVSKNVTVLDANGQQLGILIDFNHYYYIVFSPTLNRIIYLDQDPNDGGSLGNGIANSLTAFYQSSDCTGTPYYPSSTLSNNQPTNIYAHDLAAVSPSEYFIFMNLIHLRPLPLTLARFGTKPLIT